MTANLTMEKPLSNDIKWRVIKKKKMKPHFINNFLQPSTIILITLSKNRDKKSSLY
jgi:hypothetical protein